MKYLYLGDLKNYTQKQIKEHLINEYEVSKEEVDKYDILVAYESVGDYGCDSSSWFLLKDKTTGELFEIHGSHCSCHGFEGQFEPEPTTLEYLKSERFTMYTGGYDYTPEITQKAIYNYIKKL